MIVLVLERVPEGLRGELTRWLLELRAGVFVGRVSAMVRQRLWERACGRAGGGACTMVYSAACEQGFHVEQWGAPGRALTDWEGLTLVRVPKPPPPPSESSSAGPRSGIPDEQPPGDASTRAGEAGTPQTPPSLPPGAVAPGASPADREGEHA